MKRLVMVLSCAGIFVSGCKRSAAEYGGTGEDTGVIYARGAAGESTNSIIKSDGYLTRKENTNTSQAGTPK